MYLKSIRCYIEQIRFRGYIPKPITKDVIWQWLNHFEPQHQDLAFKLLKKIKYFSQNEMERSFIAHNTRLLGQLNALGIPDKNIIYVSLDDAGSSSDKMIIMLKERVRLEKRIKKFIHAHDIHELAATISKLENGAIIYVDDFAGTGKQFLKSRNFIAKNVPLLNLFSEYLLVHCMCDEAYKNISPLGIDIRWANYHSYIDRPLHPNSTLITEKDKEIMMKYCRAVSPSSPLGYGDMAAMVTYYRNSPNNMPSIFRGKENQQEWMGILPRLTDVPVE